MYLELGLNFDDFWRKISKNVKINHFDPPKAHRLRKARLLSLDC